VPLLQVVAVGAVVPKVAVVLVNPSQVKLVLLVAPSLLQLTWHHRPVMVAV
jgi:hypothetical protein